MELGGWGLDVMVAAFLIDSERAHASVDSLEEEIVTLERERDQDASVHIQLQIVKEQMNEFVDEVSGRKFELCPDTAEARNRLETAVYAEIQKAGLRRVSTDRKPGVELGGVKTFMIELLVEGHPDRARSARKGLAENHTAVWMERGASGVARKFNWDLQ